MMQTEGTNPDESENWVSPEEPLTPPPTIDSEAEESTPVPASPWLVVALNRRVNRDWGDLIQRAAENARRCYEDLQRFALL